MTLTAMVVRYLLAVLESRDYLRCITARIRAFPLSTGISFSMKVGRTIGDTNTDTHFPTEENSLETRGGALVSAGDWITGHALLHSTRFQSAYGEDIMILISTRAGLLNLERLAVKWRLEAYHHSSLAY